VLVVEPKAVTMVHLDIVQVHQLVVLVQYVIMPQVGLVVILVRMTVFQLITVLMIELVLMSFDQIHVVIMMKDVIMVIVLDMMHQLTLVVVGVDK
jgi:hypothetical protein